jgi:hypothetical protein
VTTVNLTTTSTSILAAAMLAAGCAHPVRFVNPAGDLGVVRTVAVLTFENLAADKIAAERVQKIFTTELLALGAFEVVEPGEVARTLKREQVDPAKIVPEEVKKLGKALKSQALFLGSVLEYEEGRSTSTPSPQVTIQLRLLDTETGTTLWSVSRTSSGPTATARLFGLGGKTAIEVTQEMIREELGRLVR